MITSSEPCDTSRGSMFCAAISLLSPTRFYVGLITTVTLFAIASELSLRNI